MGLNLKDLVVREKTTLEAFSNKIVAIDAYNAIYQFLASIRGSRWITVNRCRRKNYKSSKWIAV